ncbi:MULTISPECIES: NCS2 family permease [unclassified Pyramidobacter]|uniref:NCS2 family permease n=1 Tax=unclassified Pyramidobacter TaxID=2632171 RepID=UPI0018F3536A|nr:NCS2 family permease [Pyramidobacter sp. CG50-2]
MVKDLLAALAVVVNGIPQGLLALMYGFAALPTALAFLAGVGGSLYFNSVATISFQAETIALAGNLGKDIRERLSMVFWGAVFLLVPSLLGLNEAIVSWIGPAVVDSMMAGVGLMLANVSVDMLRSEKYSGSLSVAVALAVWFWTRDLAWTIIVSVTASTLLYNYLLRVRRMELDRLSADVGNEKFRFGNIEWRFWSSRRVFSGALAMACINIGANISFGKITGSIARVNANVDHLAIYSSAADIVSTLFGGSPVESIISGTATAPHPVLSSVMMMGIMAALLIFRLLPTIGRYVHRSSIAGFLLVLGVFVTFINNAALAIGAVPPEALNGFGFAPWGMVVGATIFASARWNPFVGLVAGTAIRMIFHL